MTFTVRDGRIERDGRPFVPLGVNYHPSIAGCRIWTDWDGAALERDFAAMAAAGLNTVRLFVFWRDFEAEPGRHCGVTLGRLREAVAAAERAGLACVLSLLTIWMNGQRLDLPWRAGRDLWRDDEMIRRQEGFATAVAGALRGLDNVLAFDLGDEIGNVDPATSATLGRVAAARWAQRLAGTLRTARPGTLVMQANDASGVFGATPFGVDNAGALDVIATHGYPTWAPGSIESTLSYKATNLASFLTCFAAAYGTPFVDEIGSYGVDEATAAAYLRAASAATLANGAAGLLAWCWQDLRSVDEPYRERPNERHAGLLRADGTAKPALAELVRLAGAIPPAGRERRADIALFVPELQRSAGESYLDGEAGALGSFYAYLLLKRAHLDFDVVAGDVEGYRLVICPSVTRITQDDLDRLRRGAEGGATVYYSMGEHLHGFAGTELTGVRLVDYQLLPAGKECLRWDGEEYALDWTVGPGRATTLATDTARVVARYSDGSPALTCQALGEGQVVFCGAPYERQLDRAGRLDDDRWWRFYRRLAALAGVEPAVDCDAPEVEIVPERGPRPRHAVVVNHAANEVRVQVRRGAGATACRVPVRLAGKDWTVVSFEQEVT